MRRCQQDVTDGSEREEVEAEEPGPPNDGVGVACGVVVAPLSEWTAGGRLVTVDSLARKIDEDLPDWACS